jgi:23S rRNA (adenine2503-C2)-methyltransferase
VTIEYILLKGINDSVQHAKRLGALLSTLKCNINLIPYNPIGQEYDFERPTDAAILSFMRNLSEYGKKVTVRVERGTDIAAACGQLANQYQQKRREERYASKPTPSS